LPVFVPAAAAVFTFLQSEMPDRGHQFIHSWCRICVLASSSLMRCCCLKYMHTLMQQSSEEEEEEKCLFKTWLSRLVRAYVQCDLPDRTRTTQTASMHFDQSSTSTTLPLTNKKFDAFSILTLAFQYKKYIKDRSSLRSQLFLCAKKKDLSCFRNVSRQILYVVRSGFCEKNCWL
jgi:hypothetical protein